MSDEWAQVEAELAEIEEALAAPEALPAATRAAILAALQDRRATLRAQLAGSGALAQGDAAQAASERSVVGREIQAPVGTGDGSITAGGNVILGDEAARALPV